MPRTILPMWLAVAISLLVTAVCFADGKAFPMVADPLADTGTTMPRQRAIIAWDGSEQRLAVDTAFTGEGAEFAWLVPLPSEPEILPATRGMFDTAAVLTVPRIERSDSFGLMVVGSVLVIAAFGAMTLKSIIGKIVLTVVLVAFSVLVFLPALGTARGSANSPTPVKVLSTGTAGIYDTAVLRAQHASELIQWLTSRGYGVPDGVERTVQDYLDKGWVFAAAKLSVHDASATEHIAHPLQFRFSAEAPVYPMALTAVGNGDIELELFVFARGSASGEGLRPSCSLETRLDTRNPGDTGTHALRRERPVTIAHPGLSDITQGLGHVTRLVGTLTPAQQRSDIVIEIGSFVEHDPSFYVPGTGFERGIGVGLIVAGALGLTLAMFFVDATRACQALAKQQGRVIAIMAVVGVGVGTGVAIATPVYQGEITSGRIGVHAENTLRSVGQHLPIIAVDEQPNDRREVLALFEMCAPEDSIEALREGDSPLHYRLEPGDTEASLWFIWHDAIGGEHRSLVPLAPRDPIGAIRFDEMLRQDLEQLDANPSRTVVHEVDLGRGLTIPVEVAFTTKGNGTMTCLNLQKRIYDVHDDSVVFAGWFASVIFVDVNEDGYRDLVIASAILESQDDKRPAISSRRYTQSIRIYRPEMSEFSENIIP